MKTDHEQQTEFLRHCLAYGDKPRHHGLAETISELQREVRCIQRASWLMVFVAALALAGLCYSAVFLQDYPRSLSSLMANSIPKILAAVGLGAMLCLPAFAGLGMACRRKLNLRREEGRRVAAELLENRLGKPRDLTKAKRPLGSGRT